MVNLVLLAYLAGIVDGEGSIRVHSQPRSRSYSVELTVKMNDRRTVELIHEHFGGSFFTDGHHKEQRIMYCWNIRSRKAVELLQELLPYLIYKKPQAELCIEFAEFWHSLPHAGKGVKRTEEQLAKAEAYHLECKRLKTL